MLRNAALYPEPQSLQAELGRHCLVPRPIKETEAPRKELTKEVLRIQVSIQGGRPWGSLYLG